MCLCGKQRNTGAVLLALAVGVKVFAWLLLPFLLYRQKLRIWLILLASLLLLYTPFLFHSGSEFFALRTFAEQWQFNPALFALALPWLPQFEARLLLGACLGIFLLCYWLRYIRQLQPSQPRPIPRGDLIFGALLLVSPVINAWYLLWVLPFAVLQRNYWPWVSSVALLLSYLTWLNLENYQEDPFTLPLWVTIVQFSVIAISLAVDGWRYWQHRQLVNG